MAKFPKTSHFFRWPLEPRVTGSTTSARVAFVSDYASAFLVSITLIISDTRLLIFDAEMHLRHADNQRRDATNAPRVFIARDDDDVDTDPFIRASARSHSTACRVTSCASLLHRCTLPMFVGKTADVKRFRLLWKWRFRCGVGGVFSETDVAVTQRRRAFCWCNGMCVYLFEAVGVDDVPFYGAKVFTSSFWTDVGVLWSAFMDVWRDVCLKGTADQKRNSKREIRINERRGRKVTRRAPVWTIC